ncbi:MAG: bifunctional hydroxymethylpyrimidine kinase/phosphomethylpyrimidine kinase [Ruminococcaceae bacterium]|nr:bifunctional hydroxymethylpyrimidine kinase/phosphomethylpyrimidine kinase [Oscillospiraceae bacterium]
MLKGAIFDFDGTLVDSMFIWETFGEDYLRSLGKEPKENLCDTFSTFTLEQAAEYYQKHYDVSLSVKEIVDGINNMVAKIYKEKVGLKQGVAEFLQKLYSKGVKMCVATLTDKHLVDEVLERLGIRDYFAEVFTTSEIGHSKKEPHIYRKALEFLGTNREDTLVFEDAFYALMTAKKDGFKVAAVYDRYEDNRVMMKANADYYISDYNSFIFTKQMKTVLTIAGSDSSGGAGIQADIKTMTMNGVYAMSAITALTAQNTTGVRAIVESSPEFLREQLDSVFEDIYPNAVKIGMVSSSELIRVIADRLSFYKADNVVLDPVMVATSGSALMKTEAVETLIEKLLPLATLVTPNIPEAEVLSGINIRSKEDMMSAAKYIGDKFSCSVLLKGGHSVNDANDLLYAKGEMMWFEGKRIPNSNTHGTGCTLSSAIASNLAKGFDLATSVQRAKDYISGALSAQLDLGQGSGPMKHNFDLKSSFAEEKI